MTIGVIFSIFIDLLVLVNRIQAMFFLGKSLQAAAMGVVALALYVGLTEVQIVKELTMMGIGILLFLGGRFIESLSPHS